MSKKIGRNDPCPCGSGKKYKRCCLGLMFTTSWDKSKVQNEIFICQISQCGEFICFYNRGKLCTAWVFAARFFRSVAGAYISWSTPKGRVAYSN